LFFNYIPLANYVVPVPVVALLPAGVVLPTLLIPVRRAQNAAILDMSMHPELQTKLLERFFCALGPYLHCNRACLVALGSKMITID
jgi:hypothetical protein